MEREKGIAQISSGPFFATPYFCHAIVAAIIISKKLQNKKKMRTSALFFETIGMLVRGVMEAQVMRMLLLLIISDLFVSARCCRQLLVQTFQGEMRRSSRMFQVR